MNVHSLAGTLDFIYLRWGRIDLSGAIDTRVQGQFRPGARGEESVVDLSSRDGIWLSQDAHRGGKDHLFRPGRVFLGSPTAALTYDARGLEVSVLRPNGALIDILA
jgi:hypothetical protein